MSVALRNEKAYAARIQVVKVALRNEKAYGARIQVVKVVLRREKAYGARFQVVINELVTCEVLLMPIPDSSYQLKPKSIK